MPNDDSVVIKITGDAGEYKQTLSGLANDAKNTGDGIRAGFGGVFTELNQGLQLLKVAWGAMSDVMIGTFAGFDDSMRQVKATMNASTDDYEKLSDAAQAAGASTRFTASQSADALNNLALAGYDAEQAIEMLPNVLNMAAAGGMGLAEASTLMTDSSAALGIAMGDVSAFSDQIAVTSQKTNTNISQLGQAILTIGGTAKNLAGGRVELNTQLGILANNGIKGAEGGTHLRNVLMSLTSPTSEAEKMMKKLGVTVYDAQGNLRSTNDIFVELSAAMENMTSADKTNAINAIFNKTDIAAVNALLGNCGDKYNKLAEQITNSTGAAADMAGTMEEGLGGAMRSLDSAIEGVKIAAGKAIAPAMQSVVQDLTGIMQEAAKQTDVFSIIQTIATKVVAKLPDLMKNITNKLPDLLASSFSTANGVVDALFNGIAVTVESVVGMLPELVPTIVMGIIKIIPTIIGGIGKTAFGLLGGFVDAFTVSADEAWAEAEKHFDKKTQETITTAITADYDVTAGEVTGLDTLPDIAQLIYDTYTDGLADTPEVQQGLKDEIDAYIGAMNQQIEDYYNLKKEELAIQLGSGEITQAEYNAQNDALTEQVTAWKTQVTSLDTELRTLVTDLAGQPTEVVEARLAEFTKTKEEAQALIDVLTKATAEYESAIDASRKAVREGNVRDSQIIGEVLGAEVSINEAENAKIVADIDAQKRQLIETGEMTAEIDDMLEKQKEEALERQNKIFESNVAEDISGVIDVNGLDEQTQALLKQAGAAAEYIAQIGKIESEMEKVAIGSEESAALEQQMQDLFNAIATDFEFEIPENADPNQFIYDYLDQMMQGGIDYIRDNPDKQFLAIIQGMLDTGDFDSIITKTGDNMIDFMQFFNFDTTEVEAAAQTSGENVVAGLENGIKNKSTNVRGEFVQMAEDGLSDFDSKMGIASPSTVMFEKGGYIVQGLINGIQSKRNELVAVMTEIAQAAIDAATETLQIHSPSKVFEEIGRYTGAGYIDGLTESQAEVRQAMYNLVGGANYTNIGGRTVSEKVQASITNDEDGTPLNFYIDGKMLATTQAKNNQQAQNNYNKHIAMGYGR